MNFSVYILLVIKVWDLPKGGDFLSKISLGNLKKRYEHEEETKPKLRLLCALHRKEGGSIDDIASATNMKRRTVHAILHRFAERGIEAKNSIKQKGKEPKLNLKQRQKLVAKLEQGPPYNPAGLWTTKEVRELIKKEFGVKYTTVHVWGLLQAAGFSIQKPRPRNYRAPSKWKQTHFKKKLQCWRNITGQEGS